MNLRSEIRITFKPPLAKVAKKFGNINVNNFLQKKVKELAFLIERESKQVTPVDTGRLRASIGVDLRPFGAIIQPHTAYEFYVHEGTRYMRGRPFMFWGAKAAEKGFDTRIAKDLEIEIQRKIK